MRLPSQAIKRPIAVLMAVCIVLVLGVFSFINLPLDLLPEMKFPMMAVFTTYEGASPEEVEAMITRPLEETLATVPGVEKISSTSSQNSSVITLEFSWGTDMDFRALDVREKIDMIKGFLPSDAQSPMVFQFDPSMMPVMSIAVMGDMSPVELKRAAEDVVKPRLERIEGVASVSVYGGVEREIQVEVDPARLAAHGLSIDQLSQLLRAGNLNVSAGRLVEGSSELRVRTIGEYRSLVDVENIVIMNNQAGTLYLRDVATVKDGFKQQDQLMRLEGNPGISLVIYKQSDANTVKVANSVHRAIDGLQRNMPEGSGISILFDQAEFINDSIDNVITIG